MFVLHFLHKFSFLCAAIYYNTKLIPGQSQNRKYLANLSGNKWKSLDKFLIYQDLITIPNKSVLSRITTHYPTPLEESYCNAIVKTAIILSRLKYASVKQSKL